MSAARARRAPAPLTVIEGQEVAPKVHPRRGMPASGLIMVRRTVEFPEWRGRPALVCSRLPDGYLVAAACGRTVILRRDEYDPVPPRDSWQFDRAALRADPAVKLN